MNQINLNGQWQFCNKANGNWQSAQVPGCVQTDLMNLNLLPDLFYGTNEVKAQELENEEWI